MNEALAVSSWRPAHQESYLEFYSRLLQHQIQMLLKAGTRVCGSILEHDDVMTRSHEMLLVVIWLDKIDSRLPALIQQKFAREFEAGANLIDLVPLLAASVDELIHTLDFDISPVKTDLQNTSLDNDFFDDISHVRVKNEAKPVIKKEDRESFNYSPLRDDDGLPSSLLDIVKLEAPYDPNDVGNILPSVTNSSQDNQQFLLQNMEVGGATPPTKKIIKKKKRKKLKSKEGKVMKGKIVKKRVKPSLPLDHDINCENCHFTTRLVKEMRLHQKDVHNNSVRYCKKCDKFVQLASFKQHLATEHRSQPSVCPECSKPFRTDQGLLGHRLKVHNIGEGYMCEFCPYKTVKMTHLQSHMKNHSDCPKPYVCNECGASFSRKDSLSNHVKYRHEGVTYYCDQCSFSTTRGIKSFKLHMNKEHLGLIFAKCDKCGQKFKSRYALRTHMATIHGSGKYFSCPKCDYNATTKQLLQEHDMKVHELIFFRCELCPSKFVRKYALRRHMENVHKLYGVKVE